MAGPFVVIGMLVWGKTSTVDSVFSYSNQALAAGNYDDPNSQTIALLEPAQASDPTPSTGSGIMIVGGSALLPDTGPLGTVVDDGSGAPPANIGKISTYTVKDGDTISSIAAKFNVSVNTILWANNIDKGTPLKTGQSLVILPVTGVEYKVQPGDTPGSIALKFKGDPDEILQFNNIANDGALKAGSTIIIPHGEVAVVVPSPTARPKTVTPPAPLPTVVEGDKTIVTTPQGPLMRPLVGGVKTQGLHGWNAVDIASSKNTPILAAADGTVIVTGRIGGWNGGYGNYIVISHANGTQTLYAHLNSYAVADGDQVTQGQVIGYMGETGEATGVHLHFEVRGGVNPF